MFSLRVKTYIIFSHLKSQSSVHLPTYSVLTGKALLFLHHRDSRRHGCSVLCDQLAGQNNPMPQEGKRDVVPQGSTGRAVFHYRACWASISASGSRGSRGRKSCDVEERRELSGKSSESRALGWGWGRPIKAEIQKEHEAKRKQNASSGERWWEFLGKWSVGLASSEALCIWWLPILLRGSLVLQAAVL